MRIRLVVLAAAALTTAGSAFAEAPKSPPRQPLQSPQPAQPLVLASVEAVHAPGETQPASTPPKHRIARVTTCRCGDPQPSDVSDNPDQ